MKLAVVAVLLMIVNSAVSAQIQPQPNNQPIYIGDSFFAKRLEDKIELARLQTRYKRLQLMSQNLEMSIKASRLNVFSPADDLSDADELITKPDNALSERYKNLLNQKNTGLLVLLSDLCGITGGSVKNEKFCKETQMPSQGTAYSFRRMEYQANDWSDLQFTDGFFVSNTKFGEGWLASLGDVALEDVSLDTKAVRGLASIIPATTLKEAETQYQESVKGFTIDGVLYKKFQPVKENNTYLLRSVAFGGAFLKRFGNFNINIINGDKREDVLVAFRVVKKDADGHLTLLWKELERKASPKMKAVEE